MSPASLQLAFSLSVVFCAALAFRELRRAEKAGESRACAASVLMFLGILTCLVYFCEGVRAMPTMSPFLIGFHLLGLPVTFGGVFLLDRAERHGKSQVPAMALILLGSGMLFVGNYSH